MARFNINTFNPIYPEGNDKKGEIQLSRALTEVQPVDENWSPVMRLDMLPVFQNYGDLWGWGVGRQTMYRTVRSTDDELPWVTSGGGNSFLSPSGTGSTQSTSFQGFLMSNTTFYQRQLNIFISEFLPDTTIQITHVHLVGSNIQYSPSGNAHMYFHTYDVIFYGQQSPNPYVEPTPPTPPCEILPDYSFSVQFQFPLSKAIGSVDPGQTNQGIIELIPKGGGAGTQACVGQFRVNTPIPSYFVNGFAYCMAVDYSPLLTGTSINFTLEVQGINVGTYTLNDTGNTIYIPLTYITANFTIRWTFAQQTPTTGENNPQIGFALLTASCLLT